MPTLNWIGKDKIVTHHLDVPYHILEHKYGFTAEGGQQKAETGSGNMIIHGDNLLALKSLLPEYKGKVDCIYIDPPYNTGEEKWIYNDNVNDPHIKKWLSEIVGKQGEDLSRHDKWLCMMYPRLVMLHKLLSDGGVIFISIDDNEYSNLRTICDLIFGQHNFIANFIWEKRKNRENRKVVSVRHDYILCYGKNKGAKARYLSLLTMTEEALSRYSNPDNDSNGPWKSDPLTAQAGHATENQFYTLVTPNGNEFTPPKGRCWIYTSDVMRSEIEQGHVWFGENGNNVPRKKTYLNEKDRGLVPETMWFASEVGTTESAKNRIKEIFQDESPFETPKPIELIQRILQLSTEKDSIVLDSFAGSGVTGHAVLKQNSLDGGNRKFILVELMDYADTITAERNKRAITGYSYKGKEEVELFSDSLTIKKLERFPKMLEKANAVIESEKGKYDKISKPKIEDNCLKVIGTKVYNSQMPGIGGAFDFYELGEPIFLESGEFNPKVNEDAIREYIFFSETKQHLSRERKEQSKYLLDTVNGTGYYLYYEPDNTTTLSINTLSYITEKADNYVIYADTCTLSQAEMDKYNITFKQLPQGVNKV